MKKIKDLFQDIKPRKEHITYWKYFFYFIFIILVIFIILFILNKKYTGKVTPEYIFLGKSLSGIESANLNTELQKIVDNFQTLNIKVGQDNITKINLKDKMFIKNIEKVNLNKIIWQGDLANSYILFYKFLVKKKDLKSQIEINISKIEDEFLLKNTTLAKQKSGNAKLSAVYENSQPKINIINEKPEIKIDKEKIMQEMISNLDQDNLNINIEYIIPKITRKTLEDNLAKINLILSNNININLYAKNETKKSNEYLRLTQLDILELLEFKIVNDKFIISISQENIEKKINNSNLNKINIMPQEPKFEIDESSGKLKIIRKEVNGSKINIEKIVNTINNNLNLNDNISENLNLNIIVDKINVNTNKKLSEINSYGISDVLGVGYSSMRNSAPERFTNIKNGINKLQGKVIMPGEEFSTVKALTPFTAENGYVEGLVIKGKRIIPELGGGMCQVSTTLFRSAMNSGLEITDRTNHSVVVSYYHDIRNNLPGTDATIYEPAPDFKFKNDTKHPILIDTKVFANSDIYMYLWGVSDGRVGSFSPPQIFASKELLDKEPLYEASTDIPEGKTVCSGPFAGMSAVFTYTRKLVDGKVENIPYYSYYRPQRMNCLVGYKFTEGE